MKHQPSTTIRCASGGKRKDGDIIGHYTLHGLSGRQAPRTLGGLKRLLDCWSKGKWWGKLYVAETIDWDNEKKQFSQRGCSPNYRGGLWTLTCCKHDMRDAKPFRQQVESKDPATMIFTLCSCRGAPQRRQYLVSVAKVTKTFETMQGYSDCLKEQGDESLRSEKLSSWPRNQGGLGWRFGDCHADREGKVRPPRSGHVHADEESYERDLNGKHLLLASVCFVTWQDPVLCAKRRIGPSRFGITITPDNLDKLLAEAPRKG